MASFVFVFVDGYSSKRADMVQERVVFVCAYVTPAKTRCQVSV